MIKGIQLLNRCILFFVFCASSLLGCVPASNNPATLTVIVNPPKNYNKDDSVHMVGSFNDWRFNGMNTHKLRYRNGLLKTEIPLSEDPIYFTFVKNKDWQHMPASDTGKSLCTYMHLPTPGQTELKLEIPAWKTDTPNQIPIHTTVGNIQHFPDFDMPQLARKGNISVYLPPSYDQNSEKRYPVLYMLDGQNIFDEFTSYSNEWKVDEILEDLVTKNELKELIVVAIPNGERRRNEYNPWNFKETNNELSIGEGEKTITFIKQSLKPFIDSHFRTQPQTENTGIIGSSLGGLLALYAGIEHHDTFGFVGGFSLALDFKDMNDELVLFKAIEEKSRIGGSKFYFDIGLIEYGDYRRIDMLKALLLSKGVREENVKLVKDDLGRHCELDWSKRFPSAIKWLISAS